MSSLVRRIQNRILEKQEKRVRITRRVRGLSKRQAGRGVKTV